jgi:hypothetical protein
MALGHAPIIRSPPDGWLHGNSGCPAWQSTGQTVCLGITVVWVNIRYCRGPRFRLSQIT